MNLKEKFKSPMEPKKAKKQKKDKNQQNRYTPHSIDNTIVSFLQNRDKSTFWTKDKIFFLKELSYLSAGWVGMIESLDIIKDNTDNYAVKEIAKSIRAYVKEWKTLSYAMNRLPDYFTEWDANIVKSGEKSGNLTIVLKSLATEYTYITKIKNQYIGALMYPMILIVIAIGAVVGLFGFVLPQVFSIIDTFPGMELPPATAILKFFSDFMRSQWKAILAIVGIWWFSASIFASTTTGKKTIFNFIMWIPYIGQMTKYFYLIKWCRYMKIMFSAWMSYVETFQLLRDVLWIPAYQDMLERVLAWLQRWESIYDSLKHETELIPSNVSALIKVGEESANLETSVENILYIYDEELSTMIWRLSKVIEPIMMVFIGWLVVLIALWVFGLIFQVMEGAGV